jgi:hypothetical protein
MNIGNVYNDMIKYSEAKRFLNDGLSLSIKIGMKDRTRELTEVCKK